MGKFEYIFFYVIDVNFIILNIQIYFGIEDPIIK